MTPLLPDEPIEVELHGFDLKGWLVGIGKNPVGSKDHLFGIMVGICGNIPPYVKLNSFKDKSDALTVFIAKAEKHFRHLIELPIELEDLSKILVVAWSHSDNQAVTKSIEKTLKAAGFRCKDSV